MENNKNSGSSTALNITTIITRIITLCFVCVMTLCAIVGTVVLVQNSSYNNHDDKSSYFRDVCSITIETPTTSGDAYTTNTIFSYMMFTYDKPDDLGYFNAVVQIKNNGDYQQPKVAEDIEVSSVEYDVRYRIKNDFAEVEYFAIEWDFVAKTASTQRTRKQIPLAKVVQIDEFV